MEASPFAFLQEGRAFDGGSNPIPLEGEDKKEAISKAQDAGSMWAAVGKDCWCVVPIKSTLHPEKVLEGTRLTVVSPLWGDRILTTHIASSSRIRWRGTLLVRLHPI